MKTGDDIRILLLEDDAADAELTEHALKDSDIPCRITRVDTEADFVRELEQHPPDLILSDYSLPGFDGFHALHLSQERNPQLPFIFVTGTLGEEVAIETLKSGATDYVLKTRLNRLGTAVQRAMREARERADRKRAETQLRQSHEQLRALSVHLQRVREEERTRISREVHDELGQALTGLKMDLSWLAARLPGESEELRERAKSMSSYLDKTIQTVRRIATELRPGILDDFGLGAAIEWQANEFQNRTEIACVVRNEITDTVLDSNLNTAFFRIFQETLTNIMRHAEATRVDVRLRSSGPCIVLEVRDNGKGIAQDDSGKWKGVGVLGMRERAKLLGGTFEIRSEPGSGTRITVSIPFRQPSHENIAEDENTDRRRPRSGAARPERYSRT